MLATIQAFAQSGMVKDLTRKDQAQIIREADSVITLKMREYGVLGASIVLVDAQYTILAKGFGYTDPSKAKKVDEKTLFSMQSISKTLTTTAFLMEATSGSFGLDDKIRRYYPALHVQSRTGSSQADKMTFRHLLSHRAGFCHEAPLGNNYDTTKYTFEQHVQSFNGSWLRFDVNEFFSYSNMGHDLVGYVAAKRANKPIDQYLKESVLQPLAMTSSTYSQDEAYQFKNIAIGCYGNNVLQRTYIPNIAAGGLYSNAVDMGRYLQFQLNDCVINGDTLVSGKLLAQMQSVQYKLDGQSSGYGLGVLVRPFYGATMVFHPGDGYGYQALHAWIPQARIGIAIMTNDGLVSPFASEVCEYILKMMLLHNVDGLEKDPDVDLKATIELDPNYIRTLTGRYKSGRRVVSFVEMAGKLAVISEIDTIKLNAHSQQEFSAPNGEKYLFDAGQTGKPRHFVNINQYGADFYIYNDSPTEKAGPGKAAWTDLTGTYSGFNNRQPQTVKIFLKNGYLYCSRGGETKLTEFKPGVFFTSDGDPLIQKGNRIYLGNRIFTKQ
ncbi:serine hydrolase domain-containing protein [Dyadobacter luteus]|nr:serine hydrolase domain-containing protein [Dyadobacter luteus]